MTDLTARLDAIQARKDAATPGPWRWDENFGESHDTGLALTNEAGAEIVGAYNHHCCSFRDDPSVEDDDAEFIANAPTDIQDLLDLARKQQAAIDAAHPIIRDLIDPDGCSFDHHGGCQAHGYLSLQPGETCPQHDAKAWLEALEAKP